MLSIPCCDVSIIRQKQKEKLVCAKIQHRTNPNRQQVHTVLGRLLDTQLTSRYWTHPHAAYLRFFGNMIRCA
jgi:predicted transcriptional regulator